MARQPQLNRSAAVFLPSHLNLQSLREAALGCRGCDLWKHATQTVFGEGARHAPIMLIGEQPGDKEDLEGKPFVGPAGTLLDEALVEAGIDRNDTYVTNAVKHFKWEPRGKRRIHKKPNTVEIAACRPWWEAEIEVVKPTVVVCLGATAAQALLGQAFRVTKQRGELLPFAHDSQVLATVHPSSILRAIDEESRHREYELFVNDLRVVTQTLRHKSRSH